MTTTALFDGGPSSSAKSLTGNTAHRQPASADRSGDPGVKARATTDSLCAKPVRRRDIQTRSAGRIPKSDPKFVESLARGMDVLRAFTEESGLLGNQALARLTGIPKPTISRLSYTLTQLGYLRYHPRLEKYELSSEVLSMSYAYVSSMKIKRFARPYLDAFSRRSKVAVALTCRDMQHMIHIENRLPPEAAVRRLEVGIRLPLATTAAGRAYYAACPEEERSVLTAALRNAYGMEWPKYESGLQESVADYLQDGYCLSSGDWDPRTNAAGVPVHLPDGTLLALTCAAPSFEISAEEMRSSLGHQLVLLRKDLEALPA